MDILLSIMISVLLCSIAVVIGSSVLRTRERGIAASRGGEGFGSFSAYFESPFPPDIILRRVYTAVQHQSSVPKFPVRATDSLSEVYGIVDEDLDDLVGALIKECGCRLPTREDKQSLPPIRTVADVVSYLERLSKPL